MDQITSIFRRANTNQPRSQASIDPAHAPPNGSVGALRTSAD